MGGNSGSHASHEAPLRGLRPAGFHPGRLEAAIALAAEAHRGQVDKAGQPYILHPLRVMLKLEREDKRIAAVLHDTVEDCGLELGLIKQQFGADIADAVDALTRRKGESYSAFIERCGANDIARAVKWADLCDNMDLSRLAEVTDADSARNAKYAKARERLTALAIRAIDAEGGVVEDESAGRHSPFSRVSRPMTDLIEAVAREITLGRSGNLPDRVTAAKILDRLNVRTPGPSEAPTEAHPPTRGAADRP
jgi:hypothetical protein